MELVYSKRKILIFIYLFFLLPHFFISLRGVAQQPDSTNRKPLLPEIEPRDIEIPTTQMVTFKGVSRPPLINLSPPSKSYKQTLRDTTKFLQIEIFDPSIPLKLPEYRGISYPSWIRSSVLPSSNTSNTSFSFGQSMSIHFGGFFSHQFSKNNTSNNSSILTLSLDYDSWSNKFNHPTNGITQIQANTFFGHRNFGFNLNFNKKESYFPHKSTITEPPKRNITQWSSIAYYQSKKKNAPFRMIIKGYYLDTNDRNTTTHNNSSQIQTHLTWFPSSHQTRLGMFLQSDIGTYQYSDRTPFWTNTHLGLIFNYQFETFQGQIQTGASISQLHNIHRSDSFQYTTFDPNIQASLIAHISSNISFKIQSSYQSKAITHHELHNYTPFIYSYEHTQKNTITSFHGFFQAAFGPFISLFITGSYTHNKTFPTYNFEQIEGYNSNEIFVHQVSYLKNISLRKVYVGLSYRAWPKGVILHINGFWQHFNSKKVYYIPDKGLTLQSHIQPVSFFYLNFNISAFDKRYSPNNLILAPVIWTSAKIQATFHFISPYIKIQNILDQTYEIWNFYYARPRTIIGGIKINFL